MVRTENEGEDSEVWTQEVLQGEALARNALIIPAEMKRDLERSGGLKRIAREVPEDNELENLGSVFQALADPLRVKILYILRRKALCVCLIKELTGVPDSKLSYHLAVLKQAGLINGKQEGNWIIYGVTPLGRELVRDADRMRFKPSP